jgi:protein required for attachment to host cells
VQRARTKRGISIRSTIGMKTKTDIEKWILVADRHRVLLFKRDRNELGPTISLIKEYFNPDGRKKNRELAGDRPGRSFNSRDMSHKGQTGGTRHAYGKGSEPEDHVIQDLVSKASRLVEQSGRIRAITELTLVAEPRLLGLLRPAIQKVAATAKLSSYDKDLAWVDEAGVAQILHKLVGS